jgi:hypothetical protein
MNSTLYNMCITRLGGFVEIPVERPVSWMSERLSKVIAEARALALRKQVVESVEGRRSTRLLVRLVAHLAPRTRLDRTSRSQAGPADASFA